MEPSMKTTLDLECPICFEVPAPPIYQCTNGHILCSDCLKKITACALCRETMPKKPIRCLIAEQMAGAMEKLQISRFGEKQLRPTNYCQLLGLKEILDCEESIPRDQIVSHMKQHGLNGVNGSKADVIQELVYFTRPQSWFPVYFEAHDELFFLLSSTQKDCSHEPSLLISWRCVMVGDTSAAKKFSFQLCLTNSDKGLKNLFNCPVTGIENHTSSAESQIFLPFTHVKQFGKCSGGYKVEWSINVQIGKKSENENGFQKLNTASVPKVQTSCFSLKKIESPSSPRLRIIGNSRSGNTKVFMDLAYDSELIGRLVIELRNDIVPLTAENFRCLCTGEKGFGYKGTPFHYIVVHNHMLGGDVTKECIEGSPEGKIGKSIYGNTFENENFSLKHSERGILSMYNDHTKKNTNGSVFIITLKEQPAWDGVYVVFGKVVMGMRVLNDIEKLIMGFNRKTTTGKNIIIQNCGEL